MKTRLLIIFILILTPFYIQAQEYYYTGCLIDDEAYDAIPCKKENLTRDYKILPPSYSLQKYCPVPNHQSFYSTCTAWASAYAARTIAEAVACGWKDKEKITQESFSPLHLYLKIARKSNCQSGAGIYKALDTMKYKGVAKFKSFSVKCAPYAPDSLMEEAQQYKIDDYFKLFDRESPDPKKIDEIKMAISQDNPVIIAMKSYNSFKYATDTWSGLADEGGDYHAMCVTGYDDNKNGGSFQLMNSWGPRWGNGGFTWVKYSDFGNNVIQAYTIYVKKKESPKLVQPKPEPASQPIRTINLKGELRFKLSTGEEMQPKFYQANTIPYYRMSEGYISGTRYRIYISNNEPAYVYVIGSDLKNSVSLVFPHNDKISPALIFRSNNIAIPDEKWYIEMDNTVGTDYVCVLYSESALPVHDIVKTIRNASGNFYDKVKTALSTDMVPAKEINYEQNVIRFSVVGTQKTVVPVIVEITHKQ